VDYAGDACRITEKIRGESVANSCFLEVKQSGVSQVNAMTVVDKCYAREVQIKHFHLKMHKNCNLFNNSILK
jgi:hypothetical protein